MGQLIDEERDVARKGFHFEKFIHQLQKFTTSMERSRVPIIAVVGGYTFGGAIDLLLACDIVVAAKDSVLSIKEVVIGMAADIGTLQRIPLMSGNHSLMKELALTGRNFTPEEGKEVGLVHHVLPSKEEAEAKAWQLANDIAKNSPVAVYGTKRFMNEFRNKIVKEGLTNMRSHNKSALDTIDMQLAFEGFMEKTAPLFPKL